MKQGPYIDVGHKNGDRWNFQSRPRDSNSIRAHHPAEGRHALLHISRSSELTLLYQNEGQGWQSTSIHLDTVRSSLEFVSHAALGEDGADLLAVTYDHSLQLRLYRISINWNASQQSRGQGPVHTLVQPSLDVHRLTSSSDVRLQQADSGRLTHIRIVPATPEVVQQGPTVPTIFGVFTHASSPSDAGQSQGSYSTVVRWTVETFVPTLHESFKKLKPGSNANQVVNHVTVLRRQPDVVLHKAVISFESQMFDTLLAFGASDGSVEFRDRMSMDPLGPFGGSTETVANLAQSGFDHLPSQQNIHMALSADGSAMAVVRINEEVAASNMAFTHGWQVIEDGLNDNKPFVEAAAVCVARQYTYLCCSSISNDEPLALLPPNITPELRTLLLKTIFRIIGRTPDLATVEPGKQQMIVLKEPLVPRVLSAQLALATDPVSGMRSFPAQYAFAVLSLRLAGTACAQTLSRQDSTPEIVHSLRGIIKWSTDLLIYIVGSLVRIKRESKDRGSLKDAFEQAVSTSGNVALHLLLCSYSRSLIRFQIMWTVKYFRTLQQVLPHSRLVAERQNLTAMLELTTQVPFRWPALDQMISEFDSNVRVTYGQSSLAADRRGEIEIDMTINGHIPDVLVPAFDALFDTILPKLTDDVDLGELFFWNTSWLGLASRQPPPGETTYDAITKLPLADNVPLRMCKRCGSEMEDVSHEKLKEDRTVWFPHLQRHCLCLNYWVLK